MIRELTKEENTEIMEYMRANSAMPLADVAELFGKKFNTPITQVDLIKFIGQKVFDDFIDQKKREAPKKIDIEGDPEKLQMRLIIPPAAEHIKELLAKGPREWRKGDILSLKSIIAERERQRYPAYMRDDVDSENSMDVFLLKHYFQADDIIERMSHQAQCDIGEMNRRAKEIGRLNYEAKVLRNRLQKLGGNTVVGDIWDTKGSLD